MLYFQSCVCVLSLVFIWSIHFKIEFLVFKFEFLVLQLSF